MEKKSSSIDRLTASFNRLFRFRIPNRLGNYLVEIRFRNKAGRTLRRYGHYLRVLKPVTATRLALNRSSFRAGDTIRACLQNFGTTPAVFGHGASSVEFFNGANWERAVSWPIGQPAQQVTALHSGAALRLGGFAIPDAAQPGLYRWVWTNLRNTRHAAATFRILQF